MSTWSGTKTRQVQLIEQLKADYEEDLEGDDQDEAP